MSVYIDYVLGESLGAHTSPGKVSVPQNNAYECTHIDIYVCICMCTYVYLIKEGV